MYKIYLTLFIVSTARGSHAQYDIGDACVTDNGDTGICKYEHTCRYISNLSPDRRPEECGYEGSILIVCCPQYTQGILARFPKHIRSPFSIDGVQPPEPERCPPLPRIPTPSLDNPAHVVAWEKCVANQRYVHVCERDGQSYTRRDTCAIPTVSARLTSTQSVAPKEFPHMAVLGTDGDNKILWLGGGSLISDKFILTAAHIFTSIHGRLRYALLGSLDKSDESAGELYIISRLIPHKYYISTDKTNDIGLVELDRRVIFSEFIRPICLPVPGIDPENSERLVAGWGLSRGPNEPTDIMHKLIISEVSNTTCGNALNINVWTDGKMICTQGGANRRDHTNACQVDGGAPLMYKVTNSEFSCNYVVAGLASWGGSCYRTAPPTAYTKVSAYLNWIVDNVWPVELMNKINQDKS